MGVYNEQGAALEEPEPRHVMIKETKRGSPRRRRMATPLSPRRQHSRLPPKDVFDDMMFMVGGWTQDDPSCLVEQFCPEFNEWRTAARMVTKRGNVAVGTLDGMIYTVGGEDSIRCYSSVESKRNVGAKQQLVALTPWVMSADTGLGDGDECAVT
ncbi:Kelch-like protein 20 [Larimichthys crocea]|uniref:Uncharacterized protein n=1 Tax=Larimichthys crocea TaxID=215358 RepID=A0ACD3Q7P7_LARCR|nr:Kelch-like protein 20 [Larimichthys crocea]